MSAVVPICVYCTSAPGSTSDHVPPRSFFPKPRPNDLITVPACLKCNQGAGKDEEYFLATLMFSEAGITETGKKLWNGRLRRMYEKNIGLRRKIVDSMRHREFSTPAGIYLGRGMTVSYDPLRLERIAMKIVRGLYFHERSAPLDATVEVMCLFLREPKHFKAVEQHNHMLKPGSKQWDGAFQYRCGFVPGNPTGSMWLLWFWRTHIFWAITSSAEIIASVTTGTANPLYSDGAGKQPSPVSETLSMGKPASPL